MSPDDPIGFLAISILISIVLLALNYGRKDNEDE